MASIVYRRVCTGSSRFLNTLSLRRLCTNIHTCRRYQVLPGCYPKQRFNNLRQFQPVCYFASASSSNSSNTSDSSNNANNTETKKKLSIFQRFKQMYKDYWYVLVPVHVITSTFWVAGFYYMATSGVDVVKLLETLKVSDVIINPLRDSSLGYWAVTYALYKVATPVRYTITLGGTTLTINYLQKSGWIQTVPSTQQLREMYQEKKEDLMNRKEELMKRKDGHSLGMKIPPSKESQEELLKSITQAINKNKRE